MREPAILCRSMPMLRFRRDINYVASMEFTGRLTPFLIPATAGSHEKDLSALMVDVPVIPAAGFEGHVCDLNPLCREHLQVALAYKIASVCLVLFSKAENPAVRCIVGLFIHMLLVPFLNFCRLRRYLVSVSSRIRYCNWLDSLLVVSATTGSGGCGVTLVPPVLSLWMVRNFISFAFLVGGGVAFGCSSHFAMFSMCSLSG